FESPGYFAVLLPRAVVVAAILLVDPQVIVRPYRLLRAAVIPLFAMLIHLTLLAPPEIFRLVAEWGGFVACVVFARLACIRASEFLMAVRVLLLANLIMLLVQALLSS